MYRSVLGIFKKALARGTRDRRLNTRRRLQSGRTAESCVFPGPTCVRAAHLPTCVALFWFLPSTSFRLQGAHLAGTLSSSSPFHFSDSTLNGIVLFFFKSSIPSC